MGGTLKGFIFLVVLAFGFLYYFNSKGGTPTLLPGDIFIRKANSKVYIPISSALIIAVILYVILLAVT